MRIAFLLLLLLHAVVHIIWFAHAYGWVELPYFQKQIPGMVGFSWLLAALFLIASAIQLWNKKLNWFHTALIGVLISQMWIFSAWNDTKLGSLVNLVILVGILIGFFKAEFEVRFKDDVQAIFENLRFDSTLLLEEDLKSLPELLQQHIIRSGAVGKPVVKNFYLEFDGEMRREGDSWFHFTSRQYNFIPNPSRFFFMKAKVKGISTAGYHRYQPPKAKMVVRVLSIFPVVKTEVPELYPTETVTFLNDLCLFAPGALIDERIQWEIIDSQSVRAVFQFRDVRVSAVLFFNSAGDLVDFQSEDRYDINQMKPLPFSTPVGDYKEFNGVRLPSYGEAVWHYSDGPFVYGKLRLKSVYYNLKEMPASEQYNGK